MTLSEAATVQDLTLRSATLDDAAFFADMETAVRPQDPEDPVMARHWWEHPWDGGVWHRWIAERDGRPSGLAMAARPRTWDDVPERWGRVNAQLLPELRTAERLAGLLAFAEARLAAEGGLRTTLWGWEDDATKISAATARGFRPERRERFWHLDLRQNAEALTRMAGDSRARMRREGIRILTLAQDGDPARYEKLWRMTNEAEQDIPTTVPHTEMPFDAWMTTLKTPGTREDRMWIARHGDDIVGVSFLVYPPVRGVVETGFTGTARSVRGKGVARALKCETVTQAIALGTTALQTDNDSQNAPILHINESMGYRIKGEMIQFVKELERA